jgi:hypothetical protein
VANTGADIAATLKYFCQALLRYSSVGFFFLNKFNISIVILIYALAFSILKEVTLDETLLNESDSITNASCASLMNSKGNTALTDSCCDLNKSNLANLIESSNILGAIVNQTVNTLSSSKEEIEQANKSDANNRLKKFPNLAYSTLYHALVNIIEIIPTIQINQIG